MVTPFEHAFPVELVEEQHKQVDTELEARLAGYVTTWRSQIRGAFLERRNIWDECWKLYRGESNWDNKEDWQSKIVLPKSWASVKMATNNIKRLLSTAKRPWTIDSINPEDTLNVLRADQVGDLTRVFMDKAHFQQEFGEGLECGFILGLGVWKLWWGVESRKRRRVETQMVPMDFTSATGSNQLLAGNPSTKDYPPSFNQSGGDYATQNDSSYPNQLGGEDLNPYGWGDGLGGLGNPPQNNLMIPQRQEILEEVMEGKLFIRAVDPYNFYWLPGSKLNRWVGTIEDIEVPKWELIKMAKVGIFDMEKVKTIQPMKIDERYQMGRLRFSESQLGINGPNSDTATVKLTEFYGPVVIDGEILEEFAHIIIANDSVVLVYQKNPFAHKTPPYIGFSPLSLPFRTEGVGLIEMVRHIDKALSHLANLSVDTLTFRLLPLFEVTMDAFENEEDFETGLHPGKILRKNLGHAGIEGIRPVAFQDISSGTTQVWSALERTHQEGALISDIAEGLPRWRGQQTATESQLMSQQSESFMGSMASDIETQALEPMVEMAMDLVFQFIDTANDPRVASILGVGADTLAAMSREEIIEMIQGDYKVKATGITGQLMKAEMLQNLVQLMNLIGQNPEAWLPYVNQDALLRRILEAFRPTIHDIDNIITDPETAEAKKLSMKQDQLAPDLLALLPQLSQMAQQANQSEVDKGLELQRMEHERDIQSKELALQNQQIMLAHQQEMGAQNLQQQQINKPTPVS